MNEEIQEMFRQMNALAARLVADMEADFPAGMPPGAVGYRLVIHGGTPFPGSRGSQGIDSRDAQEPVTEIHRIGDEVKVVAGLPGVTEASLRLEVEGSRLIIDAGDADRHYHGSADLPPVDPASMQTSVRNGVLEVTFNALPGGPETE